MLNSGGIQKITLFGQISSPYYGNNSSNKQREMTVHHYFKTRRSVNPENVKNFESFFKCSHKNPQELWWNWLSWGPPQEWKTLQGISSLELPSSEIAAQINASQSSSNRHVSTSTVQSRLCESGLHCLVPTAVSLWDAMCISYCKAWRRMCYGVKGHSWWHCQWFI